MTERTPKARSILMCRPDYYTVCYRINPWMHPSEPTDNPKAVGQWEGLYNTYKALGFEVHLIEPIEGLPDMCYAANGGTVINGKALGARFRYKERAPEGPAYMEKFAELGFEVIEPDDFNEGEGDFLKVGPVIIAATGFRSAVQSHHEVEQAFGMEVVSLELVNPSYYHLDTCFAVLDDENVAYLPSAFSEASLEKLRARFPDAIIASEHDASVFGLNLFSDGYNVVLPLQAEALIADLTERGYKTHGLDVSELNLGGGGIKCCTLELRR